MGADLSNFGIEQGILMRHDRRIEHFAKLLKINKRLFTKNDPNNNLNRLPLVNIQQPPNIAHNILTKNRALANILRIQHLQHLILFILQQEQILLRMTIKLTYFSKHIFDRVYKLIDYLLST